MLNRFLINCVTLNINVSIYNQVKKVNINNKKYDCFCRIIIESKQYLNYICLNIYLFFIFLFFFILGLSP